MAAFHFRVRRGIASVIAALTPKAGQLLYNLTDKTLRVGDGLTLGGQKILFAQDRYDLALAAATSTIDCALGQMWTVAQTASRTLVFANQPAANRTMVVGLIINGSTGTITYPANVNWSGNVIPVLGTTQTIISLVWTGAGWTGSVASSY